MNDTFPNEHVALIINIQNDHHKGLSSELVYPGTRGSGLIENTRSVENTSMNQIQVMRSEVCVNTVERIDKLNPQSTNTVVRMLMIMIETK